jgi:adenylate kinase
MGKRLLIFGPPAAGKGTHAKRLATDLNIPHVATGDMLREALRPGHADGNGRLGANAAQQIGRGELMPDSLVISLVAERLAQDDARGGYLLDGFPRTLPQAQALKALLADAKIDGVLCLDAPEDVLVNRIAGRYTCADCQAVFNRFYRPPAVAGRCDVCGGALTQRADDNETAVRRRLEQYRAKTAPVMAFFAAESWPVRSVSSLGAIDDIYERLRAAVAA